MILFDVGGMYMYRDKEYTISFKLNNLNETQLKKINTYLGSCRFVYNTILAAYMETNKLYDNISDYFTKLDSLIEEHDWLKEIDKNVLKTYLISAMKTVYAYNRSKKKFTLKFKSKKKPQTLLIKTINKNILNELNAMGIDTSKFTDKIKYISIQKLNKTDIFVHVTVERKVYGYRSKEQETSKK
ncbi:MAG: helix-turn-helix domain-containing protein [Nanopusillaceae archaeon]